jgi:hypothetical protein
LPIELQVDRQSAGNGVLTVNRPSGGKTARLETKRSTRLKLQHVSGVVGKTHKTFMADCDREHTTETKKTDVAEHPAVFDHVGLLVNRPTGTAGLPFS